MAANGESSSNNRTNKVYLSYKRDYKTDFTVTLKTACTDRNIVLRCDDEQIKHGESIGKYMRELSKGGVIIVVLSDAYLESRFCMCELTDARANGSFKERIIPIRCPGKYTDPGKTHDFTEKWQERAKSFSSPENEKCKQYAVEITDLINSLNDPREQTAQQCLDENFATLLSRIEEKTGQITLGHTPRSKLTPKENQQRKIYLQSIHQKINEALESEKLQAVKEQLDRECIDSDPATMLCSDNPDRLAALLNATRVVLETGKTPVKFTDAAKNLFGLTVLLSLHENVFNDPPEVFRAWNGAITIHAAFNREVFAEVVISAIGNCSARFKKAETQGKRTSELIGAGVLDSTVQETGWNGQYSADRIIHSLYMGLFPLEKPDFPLSERLIEDFNGRLSARLKSKKPNYLVLQGAGADNLAISSSTVFLEVIAKFKNLTVIFITTDKGETVLTSNEGEIQTYIFDFIRLIEEYA